MGVLCVLKRVSYEPLAIYHFSGCCETTHGLWSMSSFHQTLVFITEMLLLLVHVITLGGNLNKLLS